MNEPKPIQTEQAAADETKARLVDQTLKCWRLRGTPLSGRRWLSTRDRTEAEHDEGASDEAIARRGPGHLARTRGRDRLDVAVAAAVEVTGGGVVDGVVLPPLGERV